jgi:hypothetical protein
LPDVPFREAKSKNWNHSVVGPELRIANENWTARVELDCDRSHQKNWCQQYRACCRRSEFEYAANAGLYAKHHLRTVSIEGTVEDSDLVTARHFGISLGLAAAPDQPVDAIPDSQNGQSCASDRPWSAVYPVVTTATVAPSVTVVSIRQRW